MHSYISKCTNNNDKIMPGIEIPVYLFINSL